MATWKSEARAGMMTNSVRRAFIISLVVHLTVFGLWTLTQVFDLARYFPNLKMLTAARSFLLPENKKPSSPPKQNDPVLTFVEVDPAFAVKEPPKDARFYSAISTEAANENPKIDSDLPSIEGKQEKFLKLTESQPKSKPLQPTPAPQPEEPEEPAEKQEARPKEKQTAGDLALVKPQEKNEKSSSESDAEKEQAEEARRRPRTLAEAKAASRGEKSKTEGGVARVDLSSSVAARGTLLGDYDARFVDAVRQCWYDLMVPRTPMKPGKVVVEFRIHHDGRVTEVHVVENTAEDMMEALLCETAITKPAPYEKWPAELRRELKADTREVRFTFYYE